MRRHGRAKVKAAADAGRAVVVDIDAINISLVFFFFKRLSF